MAPFDQFKTDELVRLTFCSEANFSRWADPHGIEVEVSRILYRTPKTEHDKLLGGVFHCGNRFFLQCVEGPSEAVRFYFNRAESDERHSNTSIQSVEKIPARVFLAGSMRYVGMSEEVLELQHRHGLSEFNPYQFKPDIIREFVELCGAPRG